MDQRLVLSVVLPNLWHLKYVSHTLSTIIKLTHVDFVG